uniref:MBL fold metallo-hydrolase n=1 Tax=Desulfobacca acetoxidans TaxID=60893 RepID=A0A7V6DQF1_9BACT
MKLTIVYDNETCKPELQADWGFACLVERDQGNRLLFDTGAKGPVLLDNMARLSIDPRTIPRFFISHAHWDHIGGLPALLGENPAATVFLPASCQPPSAARQAVSIHDATQIAPHFWSTGELDKGEQALVVDSGQGLVVVCGCAHPGVAAILRAAARFGRVKALVGGLHGFRDFDLLQDMSAVCACHCTQHQAALADHLPGVAVPGGAGRILEF